MAFLAFTSYSFGATLIINGEVLNTATVVAVDISTDMFKTKHTVYTVSSGTSTATFTDTVYVNTTDSIIQFRILTCDSSSDMVSLRWPSSGSTFVLTPSLDYCSRAGSGCTAYFSYTVNDSMVTITNGSTGTNPSYYWDMGDGTTYTSPHVTHIYKKDSTYLVCVYLSDSAANCYDKYCAQIPIGSSSGGNCQALFSLRKDSNAMFGVTVINQSTGTNLAYFWDFGDGKYSSLKNPTHTYSTFGYYYLCLTVADTNLGRSCISTYCDSIGMDSSGKMLKAGFSITVVDEELSAPEMTFSAINIYPNPVENTLHLDVPGSATVSAVSIYDMMGKEIMRISDPDEMRAINVSDLSKGSYLFLIEVNSGILYRKFSKL